MDWSLTATHCLSVCVFLLAFSFRIGRCLCQRRPLFFPSTISGSSSPYSQMADRGSGSCQRFGMPAMRILGGACGATVIALGVYDITQDSSDIGVVVNNVYRSKKKKKENTSGRDAPGGGADAGQRQR